ncbi:hypothetical protein BG51_28460 [Pseudomonas [fluorescens] ATCC 17400]
MDGNGRLERQHADEVSRPDPAGQASGADPAPAAFCRGVVNVADPFSHVQGAEARCAGNQVRQKHQEGVMGAIE